MTITDEYDSFQAQSECKQAQEALRESEEKYKLLAENPADLICKCIRDDKGYREQVDVYI